MYQHVLPHRSPLLQDAGEQHRDQVLLTLFAPTHLSHLTSPANPLLQDADAEHRDDHQPPEGNYLPLFR